MAVSLRQTRALKAKKRSAIPTTLRAPVGGWNARDSIAAMEPEDAVELINWFPQTTDVVMRYGSVASGATSSTVETLMAYEGGTTEILIGVSNNTIFDTKINPNTGLSAGTAKFSNVTVQNNRFQYENFATSGGNYLVAVNGSDLPFAFDGTTWTNPAITGMTTNNLINVNSHKFRLWFIEKGTLKAYYLPTSSIAGALSTLDLSSLFTKGGYLMASANWTIDAGYGVDDLITFVTSEGEVAVYRGTDPSSATTWGLVGIFSLGSPIGRRCFTKYKGDLVLICQDGLVPLSGALQSSRLNPKVALTDKIQSAISDAINSYGTNFGWQVIAFPKQNMLVLNVPIVSGSSTTTNAQSEQYVMNTITGAWGRFKGWNATCFEIFDDRLYFGNGANSATLMPNDVLQAWVGAIDAGAVAITADALQAFNDMGSPAQVKRALSIRPMFYATNDLAINAGVNIDFDRTILTSTIETFALSYAGQHVAVFDIAIWDTSKWGDEFGLIQPRMGATGVGYWMAPRLHIFGATGNLRWLATDLVVEAGGIV